MNELACLSLLTSDNSSRVGPLDLDMQPADVVGTSRSDDFHEDGFGLVGIGLEVNHVPHELATPKRQF